MRLKLVVFWEGMVYYIKKVFILLTQNIKERGGKVCISKTYFGSAFLGEKELRGTNINNRIELEYYRTRHYINEEIITYGIEIIKKEYKDYQIDVESSNREYISNNSDEVIKIIEKLKKYKVTPIGLNDVLEDLLKAN